MICILGPTLEKTVYILHLSLPQFGLATVQGLSIHTWPLETTLTVKLEALTSAPLVSLT